MMAHIQPNVSPIIAILFKDKKEILIHALNVSVPFFNYLRLSLVFSLVRLNQVNISDPSLQSPTQKRGNFSSDGCSEYSKGSHVYEFNLSRSE